MPRGLTYAMCGQSGKAEIRQGQRRRASQFDGQIRACPSRVGGGVQHQIGFALPDKLAQRRLGVGGGLMHRLGQQAAHYREIS